MCTGHILNYRLSICETKIVLMLLFFGLAYEEHSSPSYDSRAKERLKNTGVVGRELSSVEFHAIRNLWCPLGADSTTSILVVARKRPPYSLDRESESSRVRARASRAFPARFDIFQDRAKSKPRDALASLILLPLSIVTSCKSTCSSVCKIQHSTDND